MVFSMVWAFEASLPVKARAFFNILVRQLSVRSLRYTTIEDSAIPGRPGRVIEHNSSFNCPMPPEGMIWDYLFDYDALKWVGWQAHAQSLIDQPTLVRSPSSFLPLGEAMRIL